MINNFGDFVWWMGVVEDRNDPLMLGRVRVRVVGYHTKDKSILPTEDLPWATPLQNITSAATSGIGETPVGLLPGSWVVGFFSDGEDAQTPIIMGSIGGIPQSSYFNSVSGTDGFVDPSHQYPKSELMDEVDTNRLGRGVSTDTVVESKNSTRTKSVALAIDKGSWDEPESSFHSQYPYNKVLETESGHIQEFDDTPGAERLHLYHKAGTFVEIDQNGTRSTRIIGDDYQVLERNGFLYIKGKMNVTVEGSSNIYIKNECNLQVDGDFNIDVHGNHYVNVAGDYEVTVGGKATVGSKGRLAMASDDKLGLKSSGIVVLESDTGIGLKASLAAISASTLIAMHPTGSPGQVGEVDGDVDEPVAKASPQEPDLPPLGFVLSAVQQKSFEAEKIKAYQESQDIQTPVEGRQTATEYSNLKSRELSDNMVTSAPNSTQNQITAPEYSCPVGSLVVEVASKYVGVLESGTLPDTLNYGGKLGGGQLPPGQFGVIDDFMASCGLDNREKVKRTGSGYYWCAGFVNYVWKKSGLPTPPSNASSCLEWESWGKEKGYFSNTPKVGAIILYGFSGTADHIGIVESVDSSGNISTIEGNTTGAGFTSNGVGCFRKSPRPGSYIGFVLPPSCAP